MAQPTCGSAGKKKLAAVKDRAACGSTRSDYWERIRRPRRSFWSAPAESGLVRTARRFGLDSKTSASLLFSSVKARVLLTRNRHEFSRVPGLQLDDWTV